MPGCSIPSTEFVRVLFQGMPDELGEAARLDGAGALRILLRIVLPL
ncbi:hypothetical protein [Streptomyces sp. NPDC016845]